MRNLLSDLLTRSARENPDFMVLSGDHGYALFDQIRRERKDQFLNVGVAEQLMVSLAAGLARQGFRPVVYGLSAFVPVRVLEQIKLDVCFTRLPVTFLGDGAGLVYSTLGASHQCAEDIACLRPLPGIRIYSPCDAEELRVCYEEAMKYDGPSYIRLGKSDRPTVNATRVLGSSAPYFTHGAPGKASKCLIATGSMVAPAAELGARFGVPCLSVPRLKPFAAEAAALLEPFDEWIVLEEHSRYGGLASALADAMIEQGARIPKVTVLSLQDKFSELCGSYQYALSEHDMADSQLAERVGAAIRG